MDFSPELTTIHHRCVDALAAFSLHLDKMASEGKFEFEYKPQPEDIAIIHKFHPFVFKKITFVNYDQDTKIFKFQFDPDIDSVAGLLHDKLKLEREEKLPCFDDLLNKYISENETELRKITNQMIKDLKNNGLAFCEKNDNELKTKAIIKLLNDKYRKSGYLAFDSPGKGIFFQST